MLCRSAAGLQTWKRAGLWTEEETRLPILQISLNVFNNSCFFCRCVQEEKSCVSVWLMMITESTGPRSSLSTANRLLLSRTHGALLITCVYCKTECAFFLCFVEKPVYLWSRCERGSLVQSVDVLLHWSSHPDLIDDVRRLFRGETGGEKKS